VSKSNTGSLTLSGILPVTSAAVEQLFTQAAYITYLHKTAHSATEVTAETDDTNL